MAPDKKEVKIPGVAAGKELIGTPTGDDVSPEDRVRALFERTMGEDVFNGWAASIFRNDLELISASANPGRATFLFVVKPIHCNRLGNLHGGCASTIFDVCTTAALAPIAKAGYWAYAGVSRTLNVTYLRPVPEGERVIIDCEVVHAGKRLSSLKGEMRRESDGVVMVTCEHGKVSIDPEIPMI